MWPTFSSRKNASVLKPPGTVRPRLKSGTNRHKDDTFVWGEEGKKRKEEIMDG